ncbi:putative amidase [Hordeum vulgare]|nr:putative amidase [Hordeum vulgare]
MAAVTLGTETDGSILCRCRSTQLSASSPSSGSPAAPLDRTMCRTVSDAVHVLDFIVGYDEHDAAATRAASKYIPHGIAFNNQHPTEGWASVLPNL